VDRLTELGHDVPRVSGEDACDSGWVEATDVALRAFGFGLHNLHAEEVPGRVARSRTHGRAGVGDEGVAAEDAGRDHVLGLRYRVDRVQEPLHARGNRRPGDLEQLADCPPKRQELSPVVFRMGQDARLAKDFQP
jgi:hypothetical protein